MKNIVSALAAAALSFTVALPAAIACQGQGDAAAPKKTAPVKKAATASFKVAMHCGGCGDKIKTALYKEDGVVKVDVKTADKRIVVDYDATKLSADRIAKLIKAAGYDAKPEA